MRAARNTLIQLLMLGRSKLNSSGAKSVRGTEEAVWVSSSGCQVRRGPKGLAKVRFL